LSITENGYGKRWRESMREKWISLILECDCLQVYIWKNVNQAKWCICLN
jgi:hypothetical protein